MTAPATEGKNIEVFLLDTDGVMTDGTFLYSSEGKVLKAFGPEDGDALRILNRFLDIRFLTADWRGLEISKARIERDLGFPLDLVSSVDRLQWIRERFKLESVAYMADSFLDVPIFRAVGLPIAPANASERAKAEAKYVTVAAGGNGAVAEACFYLADFLGLVPDEFSN